MKQADNKNTTFLGIATDIKPYPLFLNLKQYININVKEFKLLLTNELVNQSFLVHGPEDEYLAQIIVLNARSCQYLKLNKGIDYLMFIANNKHLDVIKASLHKLHNIKGVFDLTNTKLQHIFPPTERLTSFKTKKIAVN